MKEESDDDIPEVANFFSKRAKFVPKLSAEEFQAAAELLDKIQEDKNKNPISEEVEVISVKRKCNKRKAPARGKCLNPEEIILDDNVEDVSSSAVPLSAAAKRRLRKLQMERDKELKSIEAANEKVLSDINSATIHEIEETDAEDFDKICVLTISYLSNVSRLKCYEHDKFSTIFPKVADLFKLKASELLLCLREQNIKIDDTPKSLNIVDTDILECIPYKADNTSGIEYDADTLKLFFQSSDSKEKSEMPVHKLENMQDVMERYSKKRNIPLNQLVFEFDGEKISGTETPEDMDMESGNCIDVRVLIPEKKIPDKKQTRKSARKKKNNDELVITFESDPVDLDIIFCD